MADPLDYSPRTVPQTRRRRLTGVFCAALSLAGAVATIVACLGIWSSYLRYRAAYHSTRELVGLLVFPVPLLVAASVGACVVAWWTRTARLAAVTGAVLALLAWGVASALLIR